jgi:hypothetical protein
LGRQRIVTSDMAGGLSEEVVYGTVRRDGATCQGSAERVFKVPATCQHGRDSFAGGTRRAVSLANRALCRQGSDSAAEAARIPASFLLANGSFRRPRWPDGNALAAARPKIDLSASGAYPV